VLRGSWDTQGSPFGVSGRFSSRWPASPKPRCQKNGPGEAARAAELPAARAGAGVGTAGGTAASSGRNARVSCPWD